MFVGCLAGTRPWKLMESLIHALNLPRLMPEVGVRVDAQEQPPSGLAAARRRFDPTRRRCLLRKAAPTLELSIYSMRMYY